jgi:hypothetical protein
MHILFNDVIQYSDAEDTIKSPMLSETTETLGKKIIIKFDEPRRINSIGVGNADNNKIAAFDGDRADAIYDDDELMGGFANGEPHEEKIDCRNAGMTNFRMEFNDAMGTTFSFRYTANGLYLMNKTILASRMTIYTDATYIGRIGAGIGVHIPTSVPKEPSFNSTSEPRVTLSGQVIQGAGGYNYRTLSLDSRYKIDEFAMKEIQNGFKYIGMGYPFFMDLTKESYKLPFNKFYANEKNQGQMSFEGGVRKYLYSRRWDFEERF